MAGIQPSILQNEHPQPLRIPRSDFSRPTIPVGVFGSLGFFIEPDLWFDDSQPQAIDFEILTSSHGSIKLKLFIGLLGNASGRLSKTAEECKIGIAPMHKPAAYAIPWQRNEGSRIRINESLVKGDFDPKSPSHILQALVDSSLFSSKPPDIDRGVNIYFLIGFAITSTKKFYFATWPPKEFDLAEIRARAFADSEGQYPIGAKIPFNVTVSGRNFSRINSGDYLVLSPSEGEYGIHRLGGMGKSRRLTDEEIRKEKRLTSKDTPTELPSQSQESSPASSSSSPSPERESVKSQRTSIGIVKKK